MPHELQTSLKYNRALKAMQTKAEVQISFTTKISKHSTEANRPDQTKKPSLFLDAKKPRGATLEATKKPEPEQ